MRPMRRAASCMSHKVRILALARAILVTVMGLVHQNGPLDIKCLISFCVRTMANGVDAPDERTPKISAAHFCMTSDKSEHSTPGRRSEWAVRDHSRSTARVNSAFLSAAWGPFNAKRTRDRSTAGSSVKTDGNASTTLQWSDGNPSKGRTLAVHRAATAVDTSQ